MKIKKEIRLKVKEDLKLNIENRRKNKPAR
jgi:hypothetical protein